jgi:hypothetical protein
MRRIAVVVVLIGVGLPSWALADPFEQLSSRVVQFEQQLDGGAVAPDQPSAAVTPEPVPAPVPEPSEDLGIYQGDGMWEEPMTGDCAGGDCGSCGCMPAGYWGRAEYLLWWVRGANTPPLVTTSPDGTPVGIAGVLPNAQVLFGNGRINSDARSGGRFTLGYFCDPCQTLGIEDTFFFLGSGGESYFATSSGSPILARPFFNTQTQAQDALLLAYPNIVIGSINVSSTQSIVGNEVNLRRALVVDCCRRIDILAGYRFFYLNEGLSVRTNATSLDQQSVPVGTTFASEDLFNTRSQFNGGQLGVNWQFYRGCWTIDLLAKLALGGVSQRVKINGSTVITPPGDPSATHEGGVLALDSNIGTYNQTNFGVMPEIGANLRYQWSPLWTLSLGYTFIGLTNVVRPGDQIDLRLDPAQFPPGVPGTFPRFAFHESDLWLQGLNFGIECNF